MDISFKLLQFILFLPVVLMLPVAPAEAQGMAVNSSGAAADNSAMLDVAATSQGILLPRMTSSQRTAISSPAAGLLVYQTDGTIGFYFYDGSFWKSLSTPANVTLQGNTFNAANKLVQLNSSTQLPAVNGANLTNLPAGNLAGTLPAISAANVTNLSGANITTGSVPIAKLSATGTTSSSTYLRGDNTWSTISGGSSPSVQLLATCPSGFSYGGATGTFYTILWSSPTVNVSSQYNATNGRFTAAAAGDYLVIANMVASAAAHTRGFTILVNGSPKYVSYCNTGTASTMPTGYPQGASAVSGVVSLTSGDYVEVAVYLNNVTARTTAANGSHVSVIKLN